MILGMARLKPDGARFLSGRIDCGHGGSALFGRVFEPGKNWAQS
jgi:hypothetical protein